MKEKIVLVEQPQTREYKAYGSAKCRDEKHWENIIVDGHCNTCKHAFSLSAKEKQHESN